MLAEARRIVAEGEREREAAVGRALMDAASRARVADAEVLAPFEVYGCAILLRPQR